MWSRHVRTKQDITILYITYEEPIAECALAGNNAEFLSQDSARATPRLATIKSKVTNGRRVFAVGGDGRGAWTRRWKDIVELHVADASGRDHMSEAMLSLCHRAATLEIQLEQLECCMSQGDDVEIYGRIASHLRRILETLGVERKAQDVTPSLQSYLQAKAGPP
jgi:hypothetical protein